MATKTVRLDEDTQAALEQLVKVTGLSTSALLKQGLIALKDQLAAQPHRTPYEIYKELDLGPGDDTIAPSTDTRRGVQEAILRKLNR